MLLIGGVAFGAGMLLPGAWRLGPTTIGEHARGDNHNDAIELLRSVTPDGAEPSNHLAALLSIKTKAGYGFEQPSVEERKRAARAMAKLVDRARIG